MKLSDQHKSFIYADAENYTIRELAQKYNAPENAIRSFCNSKGLLFKPARSKTNKYEKAARRQNKLTKTKYFSHFPEFKKY